MIRTNMLTLAVLIALGLSAVSHSHGAALDRRQLTTTVTLPTALPSLTVPSISLPTVTFQTPTLGATVTLVVPTLSLPQLPTSIAVTIPTLAPSPTLTGPPVFPFANPTPFVLPEGLAPFPNNASSQNVWQLVSNHPNLTTFSSLAQSSAIGLVNQLQGSTGGNVTLFVPSDQAFAAVQNQSWFQSLTNSPPLSGFVASVLAYHGSNSSISANNLFRGEQLVATTLTPLANLTIQLGTNAPTAIDDYPPQTPPGPNQTESMFVNTANVTYSQEASNGYIHVIDQVLNLLYPLQPYAPIISFPGGGQTGQ